MLLLAAALAIPACGSGGGGGGDAGGGGGLPTVPGNVTVTTVSHQRIDVDWDASTAAAGIAGYSVMKVGRSVVPVLSGTSISDTGLDPETLYCYQVAAFDNSGNYSAFSSQPCAATDPDLSSPWTTVRIGTEMNLEAVVSDGTRTVIVGDDDEVLLSDDGVDWTSYNPPSFPIVGVNDVAFNGSQFVAVKGFQVFKSPDGLAWTSHQTGIVFLNLYGVTWSPDLSKFVSVGYESWDDYGVIVSSSDGSTWSTVTTPALPSTYLYDVAWGSGRFVTVGGDGTILASSDGSSWNTVTSPTIASLTAVARSDSRFVAVGNNVVVTSADGLAWSLETATPGYLDDITWSGSLYVAVGMNNIVTSPDGVNWTDRSPDDAYLILNGVTWTGSRFVVVGNGGEVLTSPDGITWTTTASGHDLRNVKWDGTRFVAMGAGGKLMTSADGDAWTYGFSGDGGDFLNDLAFSGTLYALGAQSVILTTQDLSTTPGSRWLGATSSCNGMLWDGSRFVGAGYSSGGITWISPDGGTWTSSLVNAVSTLEDVAYNGSGQYVAVGYGGAIVASNDASTWDTTIVSGTSSNLYGVTWSGSMYVAVGAGGTILTSSNGTTWVARTTGVTDNLYSVTWTGNDFVVVGYSGTILESANGIDWTAYEHTYKALNGVAWSGSDLVIVGNDGIIIKPAP